MAIQRLSAVLHAIVNLLKDSYIDISQCLGDSGAQSGPMICQRHGETATTQTD